MALTADVVFMQVYFEFCTDFGYNLLQYKYVTIWH